MGRWEWRRCDTARVVALYRNGASTRAITARTGWCQKTVAAALRRAGVELRRRGNPHKGRAWTPAERAAVEAKKADIQARAAAMRDALTARGLYDTDGKSEVARFEVGLYTTELCAMPEWQTRFPMTWEVA